MFGPGNMIDVTRTAAAVLVALAVLVASPVAAQWDLGREDDPLADNWDFSGTEPDSLADETGPEIREPFFAFLVTVATEDSLGTWGPGELLDFARAREAESRFPVELLDRVTRRRPTRQEQQAWPGAAVRAVWEVDLAENLNREMPYSILGYHPGSLRVGRNLLLTEVARERLTLNHEDQVFTFTDLVLFRLDSGHVILDVDGLVDHLLGKALDDAATVGFVLARQDGRLLGLAVSLGKNGRRIYGEFDFRHDRILPNGRPAAQSLSAACRKLMLDLYTGPELGAWVDD